MNTGAKVAIVGAVVGALALVAAIVFAVGVVTARNSTASTQESGGEAVFAGHVQQYLEALAAGDAEEVLTYLPSYLDDNGTSTALVTDAMLAASTQAAPITDISVTVTSFEPDKYYSQAEVKASYQIGGAPAEQEFRLSSDPDGSITLINATTRVDPASPFSRVSIAVNGQTVPADGQHYALPVPGHYQVSPTSPYYTFDNADLTFTDTSSTPLWEIKPALTEEGVQAFRTAVRSSLDVCLASKNLTAGCGLDFDATLDDGTVLEDGTITRTLPPETEAAFAALEPRVDLSSIDIATGQLLQRPFNATAMGTKDGVRGSLTIISTWVGADVSLQVGTPSVDMTDPALPVTWK